MRKFLKAIFLFFIFSFLMAKENVPLKPVDILKKAVDAFGGKEAIQLSSNHSYIVKVKRLVISSFDPPKNVSFVEYFTPPDKIRRDLEVRIPLKMGERAIYSFHIFNGEFGWSNENPNGKVVKYDKKDEEINRISTPWVDIDLGKWFYSLLEDSKRLKCEITERELENRSYYVIKMEVPDGIRYLFVKKENFIPEIVEFTDLKGDKKWKYIYSDFRRVNNVLVPFKRIETFKSKNMYEKMEDEIIDLKWGKDVKIEREKFELPKSK